MKKLNKELNLKRRRYYQNINVLFDLVNIMRDREVIFMDKNENWKCIRGLFVKSVNGLKTHFENLDMFNNYNHENPRNYNIYISRAKYTHIPLFTLDLKKRSSETQKWFKEQAKKDAYAFDLLLDFDTKDINKFYALKEEISFLIHLFEINDVCFKVFPSGNNFQIILPSETISLENKEEQVKFQNTLRNRFNLKYLCVVGENVEIYKCSYSLVDDKVILPFKKNLSRISQQLLNFNYKQVDSNLILDTINLYKRGEGLINNCGNEENKKNFNNFCNKYLL